MRKIYLMLLALCFAAVTNAQISVTVTGNTNTTPNLAASYSSMAAAITDLNLVTSMSGPVVFGLAAGTTESVTSQLTITTAGNASYSITFQKSGAGANPKVTRTDAGSNTTSTLGGLGDGIIRIDGTDNIIFDGLDLAASNSGIEYGYYTHKPSGTNGVQGLTIQNCTVTMTKGTSAYVIGIYIGNGTTSTSVATGVTVTAASGENTSVTIKGNTIQNVHAGIVCRGGTGSFYDQDFTIGASGAGNTIQNFGGGSATTTYGVYFIYVNNTAVNYNTINNAGGGGSAHGATLYGIFYSTVTGTVSGSNNIFTLANSSASLATQYIYNGNTVTSETFDNNSFAAGTLSSTGTVYLIYASNNTNTVSASGNSTSGAISRTGASGSFYGYYNFGSPTGGTETLSNNNFSSITVSGTTTFYGLYSNTASAQSRVCSNNTISSITVGTGTAYCLYNLVASPNQLSGNTVSSVTGGGSVYGLYFSGATTYVYNNNVYTLSSTGASSSIYGLNQSGGTTTNIYKNKIYDLSGNQTGTTVYGIYISSGTTDNIYNNLIGDLRATAATGLNAINGIYASATATYNVYYNTIYLNASSTSVTTFGTSCIYFSSSATSFNSRNNILYNSSTPAQNGSNAAANGISAGLRRSGGTAATVPANYATTSNNNAYWVNPSAGTNNHLTYVEGTSTITNPENTVANMKTFMGNRDQASVEENVSWQSTSGSSANFLKFSTGAASQLESGAVNIATYTDDYIGTIRAGNGGYGGTGTAPDIGAWELEGIPSDVTGPSISYTALSNTCATGSRTLTASITDASGVPTSGIGLPVLYWRINSGSWSAATGTYVSGTNYNFTFGSGVVALDVVQYYIVAQDNAGTPNVSAYPASGAGGFSINPPAASTAPTTPSSYNIQTTLASGTYTVGTSGTYTTLTAAVNAYNTSCLAGPVVFELLDATYTNGPTGAGETFPITINANVDASATNTLTIRPATGVTASISNSSSTSIFKLDGADWVIIDGSNSGGTSRNLTIENTSTSATTGAVWIASGGAGAGATNNTLKNCIIKTGSNTVATYGVTISGSTLASTGADNNNNTIQNNWIQKATYGIYATGVITTGEIAGLTITQNKIGGDASADYVTGYGLYMTGANAPSISLNEVYNMKVDGSKYGLWFGTTVHDAVLSRNNIHGMGQIGTSSSYYCIGIYFSSTTGCSNNQLSNNIIYDLDQYGSTSNFYYCGIRISGGTNYKLYYNTMSLTGAFGSSTAGVFANCLFVSTASTSMDIRNNIFYNNRTGNAPKSYTINTVASTTYANINYNDYYSSGSALGMIGGVEVANLAALQAATTQDANSIGGDPLLNSPTNMQPGLGSPVIAAADNSTGITIDYTGATRSVTTPTIGAYETAADASGPTITYTILSNTLCTANRTLSATITDASGVNTTSGTKPRLYFKKSTDANNFVGNTSSDNGWKWVEASNSSSPFSFTTNYSLLQSAVAGGDIIQYFVVAQDLFGTPNVSINSGTFAATPSSVALTSAAFPITGTINSYTLLSGGIGSDVTIGALGTYPTLTGTGGLFEAINSGGLTANITARIIDASVTENGTVALNAVGYGCASSYTLTIKPDVGVTTVLSGSSTGAIIKLNGADYVTIDGSNSGGTSRDMTITNTNTSATTAVVWLASLGTGLGSTNNTIKNCNLSNGSSAVVNYGISVSGTTIGSTGADNDDVTLQNNAITSCATGIYANGSATVSTGGIDNLNISANSVTTNCSVASIGIRVGNALSVTISQNTLDIQQSVSNAPVGISLETGVSNTTVSRNKITRVKYTASTGYGGRGITIGTGSASSNITIVNNVIYGVAGDNYTSFSGSSSVGIMIGVIGNSSTLTTVAGGINLYYNSVNMYDSYNRASACLSAALYVGSAASALDIRNNVLVNTMNNTNAGGSASKNYAVYSVAANTAYTSINYNDYYVSGTQGVLGYLGADQSSLAAWQTATTQDANSISSDPLFNSNTNLVPQSGSPLLAAATPIGSVTIDYNGISRSVTTPTIGAYEVAGDFAAPAITFTAIPNTICTSAPTLSATITDASGVNVTSGLAPRLYYRKGSETDAFGTYPGDNNSTFNGWKYVEATGSAPNFSFAIDYSKLTGAVATGDVINYFVIAQDNAGTPNVGTNTVTFNGGTFTPTSVNLPSSGATPTSGSLTYNILSTFPTTQPSTATIAGGSTDVQVLRLDLPAISCGGTVTNIDFTNASTNVADISKARVYYTTTTTFATTTQFGSDVSSPGATFSVTGSQALSTTLSNYFWLVYDISCSAPSVTGNTADASATGITIGGAYTFTPANPTGTRTITALLTGDNVQSAAVAVLGSGGGNPFDISGRTLQSNEPTPIINTQPVSTNGSGVSNYSWGTAASSTYWYRLDVPTTGYGSSGNLLIRATTPGTSPSGDAQVALWKFPNMVPGTCSDPANFTGGVLLAANDDAIVNGTGYTNSSTLNSVIRVRLTPGQTYYIQIDGYSTNVPNGDLIVEDLADAAGKNVPNNGFGNIHNPTGVDMKYASYEVVGDDGWTYYYNNNGTTTDIADDVVILGLNWSSSVSYLWNGTNATGNDLMNHVRRSATSVTAPSSTGPASGTGTDAFIVWSGRNNASAASADLKPTAPYVSSGTPHWWMMNKFWNVFPNVQPTSSIAVRFYYSDADFTAVQTVVTAGGGVLSNPSAMTFIKATKSVSTHYTNAEVDPGSGHSALTAGTVTNVAWTNTAGVQTGINQAQFNITTFSGGGGGSTGLYALPANLISFSGYKDGSRNQLHWTTASESNNRGFELQRSTDGINYTVIGFINSLAIGGNSVTQLNYAFTDNNPAGSKQYYRLRQVDIDNHSKFSNIVLIKGDKPVTLMIDGLFPNPASTSVNVLIAAPNKDKVTMVIIDVEGRKVSQQIVKVETGNNTIPVDISHLSNGTYMVKLVCSSNCESAVAKFVKQ